MAYEYDCRHCCDGCYFLENIDEDYLEKKFRMDIFEGPLREICDGEYREYLNQYWEYISDWD